MSLRNKNSIQFIGIGAMKCGTTWVSKCLEEHPEILFSSEKSLKELHYFSSDRSVTKNIHGPSNYSRGMGWYLNQFPEPVFGRIRGEYCNSYFTDPLAPKRIKSTFPDSKLILTLRNPVEMSYSLYWWIRASLKNPFGNNSYLDSFNKYSWYREKGLYSIYLKEYYKIFKEKSIHIIFFDDIKLQPKIVTKNLYIFLGLKDTKFEPSVLKKPVRESIAKRSSFLSNFLKQPALFIKNKNSNLYWDIATNKYVYNTYKALNNKPNNYPKMINQDRRLVTNYYVKDIKYLEKMTGKDLTSWYKL